MIYACLYRGTCSDGSCCGGDSNKDDCCIAWCTRATGGTAYTLRYAQRQGLRVWNVAQIGERG